MADRDATQDTGAAEECPRPLRPLYDTSPVYRAAYEAFFSGFKRWPPKAKDAVSLKQLRELARFVAEEAHFNHERRLYSCDPGDPHP